MWDLRQFRAAIACKPRFKAFDLPAAPKMRFAPAALFWRV
jgi:hypothetical protein